MRRLDVSNLSSHVGATWRDVSIALIDSVSILSRGMGATRGHIHDAIHLVSILSQLGAEQQDIL